MKCEQFCGLIHDIFPELEEVLPEQRIASDLGLCSFDIMMIIVQIEELYGCQVDVSLIKKDMTVREFFSVVYR